MQAVADYLASINGYPDLTRRISMDLGTMKKAFLALGALAAGAAAMAQSNPANSTVNPYTGSVQAVAFTADVRQLSLDDAIKLGIQNNLALTLAREQQRTAAAQKLELANVLLPNLSMHGETGVHEYDL